MVKVGEKTPEFSAVTAYQKGSNDFPKISLADYAGRWLVLFFYPRDFTFICPTELKEFASLQHEFDACSCAILAASTDSAESHAAWFARDLMQVEYPVLADTKHAVSTAYNVLDTDGASQRGTFIIDPEGMLRWFMVSDGSVGRSVKETVRALKALQTGNLCPVQWEPGVKFVGPAA
jgi:alkyl hydroperoxide reductase subunit AhpC